MSLKEIVNQPEQQLRIIMRALCADDKIRARAAQILANLNRQANEVETRDPKPTGNSNTPSSSTTSTSARADNAYRARNKSNRLTTVAYHADVSYEHQPPGITILALLSVPPTGGDTAWASQTAANARLSLPIRALLDGLRAEHSGFPQAEGARGAKGGGQRALFVNPGFTKRIVGSKDEESDAILQLLLKHISLSQDLQAHTAISDYDVPVHNPHEGLRHGFRITTQADKPTGVNGLESTWE
ncbi:hypothetical protein B0T22DRAFT_495009 [Podospora appendiculata]|uniref:TauD/TfdA-like domain-containing protein n=1 Tax=Podospora appendiculata TaxID=314037 RepID=A0AAE1C751_9PEZI|nr:hypothetical protein B0T22DRAFT_495009 [Podospora appendiculata]